jgi:hypothetical protein
MATGVYKAALDIGLFLGLGTTASSIPTSKTGLTEILSLSDASISTTSEQQKGSDYKTPFGYSQQVVTDKTWSMPAQFNLDVTSEGYALLKRAEKGAPSGITVRMWRELPLFGSTHKNPQVEAAVASVANYNEALARGGVMAITFNFINYSELLTYQQGNPIATLTITTPGAGLSAGTAVPLVPVAPGPGDMSGLGATATITVNGSGATQTATIVASGQNFRVGDTLTITDPAVVGAGDTPPLFTVATVA